MQPVTCVVSNLKIHSQHPSDDYQHKLKYSSRHLEIHCHHHRSDDYRHNLAIALNITLYTLMMSPCPHPHRHSDDQQNLMGLEIAMMIKLYIVHHFIINIDHQLMS